MMVQCSLFGVFLNQFLKRQQHQSNKPSKKRARRSKYCQNNNKQMCNEMMALTLRFSSICVMACKKRNCAKIYKYKINEASATDAKLPQHQGIIKKGSARLSSWILKYLSHFKYNNRKAIWRPTFRGTHPHDEPITAVENQPIAAN